MASRLLKILTLGVVATGILSLPFPPPHVDAQGVSSQIIAQFLDRTGVKWEHVGSDGFRFAKTDGLKKAERIEVVVTNFPTDQYVTVRAFPQLEGKFLILAKAADQAGLMKDMLQRNATTFGAYFVDGDGDLGYRYVFTTESGLGYEAFKVVIAVALRIADEAMIDLYKSHR